MASDSSSMRCPICNTEFAPEATTAMPFCSDRCRQIDLGRWLEEGYALPRTPDPEDDEKPEDDWAQQRAQRSAGTEEARE